MKIPHKAIIKLSCAFYEMVDSRLRPGYNTVIEGVTFISGDSKEDCIENVKRLFKKNNITLTKELDSSIRDSKDVGH